MTGQDFDALLQSSHDGLTWSVWIVITLVLATTIVRRAFIDTESGHFHPRFRELKFPENFDEGAKISRIGVMLTVVTQLLRISWVVLWIPFRLRADSVWYLSSELEASLAWRGLGLVLELLILSIIFFELLPQVISTWRGKRLALGLLPSLSSLETTFSPLTRSYRWLRSALLRFVGNGVEQTNAERAEESIRAAVEAGEREGLLQPGEKSMIESLLEFHEAEIVEVMTPRTDMVCLEADTPIAEATEQAIACGHSRIPVYEKDVDHIIGVLYVKDLLKFSTNGEQQRDRPIQSIVRKINFVPETKKVQELLAEFRAERFHIAVVLDEYGGTSGLVTIEDILEEIVGDIEDEYDPAAMALIRRVDPNTFDLDGRAAIDDVNDVTGTDLPESDDYETLAGFLMSSMGRLPKEGECFDVGRFSFKVTSADERKIKRVRMQESPAT